MDRRNGAAIAEGICKREKLQNRANQYENLPYSFDGSQGPTAWRKVRDPSRQMVAADLKADAIERILREKRGRGKKRMSKKEMRKLIYQWEVANGMERGR